MNEQGPATIDRSGLRALWLGLAALFLTPFWPAGLAAGIGAVVVAVRTLRRAGRRVPGAVPGLVMGLLGGLFSAYLLGMSLLLWSELNGYQQCIQVANTNTDEQACKDIWLPRMEHKLHLPKGSLKPYRSWF